MLRCRLKPFSLVEYIQASADGRSFPFNRSDYSVFIATVSAAPTLPSPECTHS